MQTVLITEDSPTLREPLDIALTRAGYFTIVADTAQEALGVLRTVRVDLLLTRERLTDVEGSVLAEIARHRGLDELVVVLLADDAATVRAALAAGVADLVLERTTDLTPVVAAVRRLLRPVVVRSTPPAAMEHACALARA